MSTQVSRSNMRATVLLMLLVGAVEGFVPSLPSFPRTMPLFATHEVALTKSGRELHRVALQSQAALAFQAFVSMCYVVEDCNPYSEADCKHFEPCPTEDFSELIMDKLFAAADAKDSKFSREEFNDLHLLMSVVGCKEENGEPVSV